MGVHAVTVRRIWNILQQDWEKAVAGASVEFLLVAAQKLQKKFCASRRTSIFFNISTYLLTSKNGRTQSTISNFLTKAFHLYIYYQDEECPCQPCSSTIQCISCHEPGKVNLNEDQQEATVAGRGSFSSHYQGALYAVNEVDRK